MQLYLEAHCSCRPICVTPFPVVNLSSDGQTLQEQGISSLRILRFMGKLSCVSHVLFALQMSSTRSRSFSRASSGLPFPFVICQVGLPTFLSLSSGPMKPRGGGKHDAHGHESMAFHADHFAIHRRRCQLSTMDWICKQVVLGVVSKFPSSRA